MRTFIDLKCDYNLYKNFLAVAKLGSFSKAAKCLFVSQPAISYNIKQLENQLGVSLLIRNNKTIDLTPEGEKLYKFLEEAHNNLVCGERNALEASSLLNTTLAIGVPTHIAKYYLIPVLEKFKNDHPTVSVSVISRSTQEMVNQMLDNALDLIIDTFPIANDNNNVIVKSLGMVETCFAGTPEAINAEQRSYILPNKYTATRHSIDALLGEHYFDNMCSYEISTTEISLELVLRGKEIGFFLKPSVQSLLDDKILQELWVENKEMPVTEYGYAYNKKYLSTTTKKFIKYMENKNAKN